MRRSIDANDRSISSIDQNDAIREVAVSNVLTILDEAQSLAGMYATIDNDRI